MVVVGYLDSLVMTSIYPTLIAPLFNKFEPLKDLELKAKIEALASRVSSLFCGTCWYHGY